ncbi:hypothetical protein D3C73_1248770 [compost metagenome]
MAVGQRCPAHILAIAVVLGERVVLEHHIHGRTPDIDNVGLLAVGVILARTTSVIRDLPQTTVDAHGEANARNNVRILAVRLTGKLNIQLTVDRYPPAVGATHTEIKYRRGDDRLTGNHHRIVSVFEGKIPQMLLHNL